MAEVMAQNDFLVYLFTKSISFIPLQKKEKKKEMKTYKKKKKKRTVVNLF